MFSRVSFVPQKRQETKSTSMAAFCCFQSCKNTNTLEFCFGYSIAIYNGISMFIYTQCCVCSTQTHIQCRILGYVWIQSNAWNQSRCFALCCVVSNREIKWKTWSGAGIRVLCIQWNRRCVFSIYIRMPFVLEIKCTMVKQTHAHGVKMAMTVCCF